MKIKIDFFAIFATLVVLYCNGGILSFFKGSSLMTLFIYGVLLLWLAWAVIHDRTFLKKYITICSFVFVFFVFINLFILISDSNVTTMMVRMRKNLMFLLAFVAIFIYYSAPERYVGRRMILFAWIADTGISSIYTIYRLAENPTLSRILATEDPEKYLNSGISIAGVLGFGSIYGLIFIVVAMLGLIKKTALFRNVWLIGMIALYVYTIIQAQFFIAAVLCIAGIVLCIFESGKLTSKKIVASIFFIPLALVVFYVAVSQVLPALIAAGSLPHFIAERLKMFLSGISFGELLDTARGFYYLKSVLAIKESFGLGVMFTNSIRTGGHSEILDLIAIYGVPLAALLICGIYRIKKAISQAIPDNLKPNYNIVWILFLTVSIFNTSLWCQTTVSLILMIPLVYMELGSDRIGGK